VLRGEVTTLHRAAASMSSAGLGLYTAMGPPAALVESPLEEDGLTDDDDNVWSQVREKSGLLLALPNKSQFMSAQIPPAQYTHRTVVQVSFVRENKKRRVSQCLCRLLSLSLSCQTVQCNRQLPPFFF
jgi:hypothetical protein